MRLRFLSIVLASCFTVASAWGQDCGDKGPWLQVLGSGGPDLIDGRSASSYLLWLDGKARMLLDTGPGSAINFLRSGASLVDIDVIAYTHLHVDHSADLPALILASTSAGRKRPLPLYGPEGNPFMPSTVSYIRSLFDSKRGAYRYLGDYLSPLGSRTYKLQPHNVRARLRAQAGKTLKQQPMMAVYNNPDLAVYATAVRHGKSPALAWRVQLQNKVIVFSGDADGSNGALETLAKDADLFVAHHAIGKGQTAPEGQLTPSVIARIAYRANVRQLLLSHRTPATLGQEKLSTETIKRKYAGMIGFANDMECYQP